MGKVRSLIREKIKDHFALYDFDDLIVGANCGCCGDWMPQEIVEKCYRWSLCEKCIEEGKKWTQEIECQKSFKQEKDLKNDR